MFTRYLAVADRLKAIADAKSLSMVQFAIAWQLRLPTITCVLVGAKSAEQAIEYTGAVDVSFAPDELQQIETILADLPR
jgi:aryl-alcohol dehydrogenase-like predicted oxidoreductase